MRGARTIFAVPTVLLAVAAVAVLVFGCSGEPKRKSDNPFFDNWRARAERSKGFSPSRKKIEGVSDRKQLGYSTRERFLKKKEPPLPTRRVTVKLREMDVGMVLRAVSRAVDQNIIINESVKGTVSVDVHNVPWNQVFTGILKTQGLDYEWEGAIIRVMSAQDKQDEIKREIETVIVPVEYADAENLRENLQKILTANIAAETAPIQAGQTPAAAAAAAAAQTQSGTVMVDKHNNALIIQASRPDIERLLPLVETLDRPTAQVLIEAHIVEARKETARQLGVQWGGLYQDGNQYIYPGAAAGSGVGISGLEANGVGIPATANWNGSSLGTGSLITGSGLSLGYVLGTTGQGMLAAQLNALQTENKLNILSSPSITTIDQYEATIESGKEIPFETRDENGQPVVQYKSATLLLTVTPSIIDTDILKLKIETRKDEVDTENTVNGNPHIFTKNATTNVVLKDGETTVIGGLNLESESKTDEGVPGLMDIPVLGWLFKSQNKSKQFEELLIFITPFILKERTVEGAKAQM